jgi:hypothetical protein
VFRIEPELNAGIDAERIAQIREHERAVLLFGPDTTAAQVNDVLDRVAQEAPLTACASIVVVDDDEQLADFQALIDADRLFYLSRGALPARDLAALIDHALSPQRADVSLDRYLGANDLRRMALAQNVTELAEALRSAASHAVDAERTRCVLFDGERQVLWVPGESTDGESAAVGLVSFILRSGVAVCLPRLGGDPRFDRDLDNPHGEPTDRFIGVPIRAGRGTVAAVLVALRPAYERPFEPLEIAAMEAIAAHASPYVAAWLLDAEETGGPFRRRALRELEQPTSGPEPLRLDPAWTRRASWLAIATFAAFLFALAFVRVRQYETAGAFVRSDGAVVAAFASDARIRPGMELRFNNQTLRIESAVTRDAQTIVITTKLPRAQVDTRGKAEMHLGSERLLFALAPSLKEMLDE